MVITVEIWYQIPCYFNLRKSRYCSKLQWYFYNTGQKCNGILTLGKGGTMVNYHNIYITLALVFRTELFFKLNNKPNSNWNL